MMDAAGVVPVWRGQRPKPTCQQRRRQQTERERGRVVAAGAELGNAGSGHPRPPPVNVRLLQTVKVTDEVEVLQILARFSFLLACTGFRERLVKAVRDEAQ
jgi:hypothetical protein